MTLMSDQSLYVTSWGDICQAISHIQWHGWQISPHDVTYSDWSDISVICGGSSDKVSSHVTYSVIRVVAPHTSTSLQLVAISDTWQWQVSSYVTYSTCLIWLRSSLLSIRLKFKFSLAHSFFTSFFTSMLASKFGPTINDNRLTRKLFKWLKCLNGAS